MSYVDELRGNFNPYTRDAPEAVTCPTCGGPATVERPDQPNAGGYPMRGWHYATTRDAPEAALAAALDDHWLDSFFDQGFVRCSCETWRMDIPGDLTVPELGEHFAPFNRHVAEAALAAMPDWHLIPADAKSTPNDAKVGRSAVPVDAERLAEALRREVGRQLTDARVEELMRAEAIPLHGRGISVDLQARGVAASLRALVAYDIVYAALAPAPSEP